MLISRLVAEPIDHLRAAAQAVASGELEVRVPMVRADEFGLLIGEFNHMVSELREKERVRQTFGLHVGRQAAEQILARDPGLGGVEQVITVMFVDIRSFTSRSEGVAPREVVRSLNQFLGIMVDVVEGRHQGLINKFLGDGFMALFGVGDQSKTHADAAVAAARNMLDALADLNAALSRQGEEPIEIGIGIHSGPAVIGSIGSPQRLEFTAIGATVNIAARVEGLTKTVGEPLLFTAETKRCLENHLPSREFPAQQIRGLDRPVAVYTLLQPGTP
jgi:adenylate cyclase